MGKQKKALDIIGVNVEEEKEHDGHTGLWDWFARKSIAARNTSTLWKREFEEWKAEKQKRQLNTKLNKEKSCWNHKDRPHRRCFIN